MLNHRAVRSICHKAGYRISPEAILELEIQVMHIISARISRFISFSAAVTHPAKTITRDSISQWRTAPFRQNGIGKEGT